MIDRQEHLLYLTNRIFQRDLEPSNKLRGIRALWREKDHTACLSFYFNGPIREDDLEEIYDLAGGVIAHFPNGLLEEQYIRWDYPRPLPEQFLAYKRQG